MIVLCGLEEMSKGRKSTAHSELAVLFPFGLGLLGGDCSVSTDFSFFGWENGCRSVTENFVAGGRSPSWLRGAPPEWGCEGEPLLSLGSS